MARRRHRRRALAIVVLAVAATAVIAHGDPNFVVKPFVGSSVGTKIGMPSSVVVSIRNNAAPLQQRTINVAVQTPALPGCTGLAIRRIDVPTLAGSASATLDPHEQAQFVITTTNGYTTEDTHTCTWRIGSPPFVETFSTDFHVSVAGGPTLDPQPVDFYIGSAALPSEVHDLLITNNTTSAESVTATIMPNAVGGSLRFTPGQGCATDTSCAITVPAIVPGLPNFTQLKVTCAKPAGGPPETGAIRYFKGGGPIGAHPYTCESKQMSVGDPTLNIVEDSLDLRGTAMSMQSMNAMVVGSDNQFVSAMITGVDAQYFTFTSTANCGPTPSQTCAPASPLALPQNLQVTCMPTSTRRDATLTAYGNGGTMDVAPLSCALDEPSLQVKTPVVDVFDVDVGSMATGILVLENAGTMLLTGVVVTTGDPAWTTTDCTPAMPCDIAEGQQLNVDVTFRPTQYGRNDPVLMVASSNGGTGTAQLRGNGLGSRMRVTTPAAAPYLVDLGTLSLDELRTKTVKLYADGNVDLDVTVGTTTSPFSVSSNSVAMPAMTEGMFDVRCQSSVALPEQNRTLTLDDGPGGYMPDTSSLMIRCKVSNTRVLVTPNALDFGEVQRGMNVTPFEVKITNPGAPVMLQFVRLSNPRPELVLSAPMTPQMLAMNGEVTATLSLITTNEATIDDVSLEVGIEGADPLVTPITGKVVTASARISPTQLELGTVCVGTPVDGQITMTNDGTATLRVQPPTMMAPFAPLFIDPMAYPSDNTGVPLFAGDTAVAGVMTANTDVGKVESTLVWDVNVTSAPFSVPVSVEFIQDGTGVSPGRVVFDAIEANTSSPQRIITLENCEERAVVVDVRGVVASKGSKDAWTITPASGIQDLEPHKTTRIIARFEPKRPGRYEAKIFIQVDGIDYFVDLVGDALGDVVERQSLYGCDCETSSPSSTAWFAIVLLFVIRRRNRSVTTTAARHAHAFHACRRGYSATRWMST